MTRFRNLIAASAVVAAGALVPAAAQAAVAGFATGNVNLRAGPSTQYPVVTTIRAGDRLTIFGCVRGYSWCDVNWRGNRGWVSSSYLDSFFDNRRVRVPGYAARMFGTLADAKVNIEMISTSEVRITCMIAEEELETALRALHEAFELERPEPVEVAAAG